MPIKLQQLVFIFNRAFSHTLDRQRLLLTWASLVVCGGAVVFCRALANNGGMWVKIGLVFCAVYVCTSLLSPLGVLLVRMYYNQVKSRQQSLPAVLKHSWPTMLNSSYFFLPFLLLQVCLWLVLGIFFLIRAIPLIGQSIGTLLAAVPFALILIMVLLALSAVIALFWIVPMFALQHSSALERGALFFYQLKKELFNHLLLLAVALIPLAIFSLSSLIAAQLTAAMYVEEADQLVVALEWFFTMIPFTGLLSAPTLFFFNFAAEAHGLLHRQKKAL